MVDGLVHFYNLEMTSPGENPRLYVSQVIVSTSVLGSRLLSLIHSTVLGLMGFLNINLDLTKSP